jgi:hypothetical protein
MKLRAQTTLGLGCLLGVMTASIDVIAQVASTTQPQPAQPSEAQPEPAQPSEARPAEAQLTSASLPEDEETPSNVAHAQGSAQTVSQTAPSVDVPGAGEPPTASVDVAADLSANDALEAAELAMLEVDYERSLALATRAIEQGGLPYDAVRRAYTALAFSAAQLDRHDIAQPAFLRLFALEPNVDFARRLAPARRSSAITAAGFWKARKTGMGAKLHFDREERRLSVQLTDPLDWAQSLRVGVRKAEGEYEEHSLPLAPTNTVAIEGDALDTLEVYVVARDAHGNAILHEGSPEQPRRLAPTAEELLLFERDIRGGETGSYVQRLSDLGAGASVHGYMSLEFGPMPENRGATFDSSHAAVFFRAPLLPKTHMELGFDVQHATVSRANFTLPHAFVDVALSEWLVVRSGLFATPVGAFNEYFYPDFVRTSASAPLFSRVVVPSLWSELGIQLRGRVLVAPNAHLTYAAFVSNGLEQYDPAVGDGNVTEGGSLAGMRYNVRDRYHSDKAVGGRVGLQWRGLDVGVSGYTGRYAVDAERRLTIADVDVSYKSKWVTVRAEAATAFQQITDGYKYKQGGYLNVSSRAEPYLEPYVQYDVVRDGEVEQRLLLGNAVYPFPELPAARTLRLKTEVGFAVAESRDADLVWLTQIVSGF